MGGCPRRVLTPEVNSLRTTRDSKRHDVRFFLNPTSHSPSSETTTLFPRCRDGNADIVRWRRGISGAMVRAVNKLNTMVCAQNFQLCSVRLQLGWTKHSKIAP